MPKVLVIFFSATGTTASLAQAVHTGAAEVAEAASYRIVASDIVGGRFVNEDLLKAADAADALAFGSPTYMGGPAAQFKAFADATSERWAEMRWAEMRWAEMRWAEMRWAEMRWADKIAAGFTTGSCANGDQGHTLAYFAILAGQHGMLWCGLDVPGGMDPAGRNQLGAGLGMAAHAVDGTLHASDLATAHHLGERLARVVQRFRPALPPRG